MLTQNARLKCFSLQNIARRGSTFSLAGIQKSHIVASFQSFNFGTNSKFMVKEKQKFNIFESNVFVQRFSGLSFRRFFSTEQKASQNSPAEKAPPPTIEEEQKELSEMLKNEKWIPIYRFPGIAAASFISKLKFLQTFGSALIIPWVTYNYASGYQSFEFLTTVYAAAILAPITLFAFSRTFNRMIGVISMNESNEYIRVGYLSFYGSRKNAILPVEDVMPLSGMVSTMEKYPSVLQLKRFSNPDQWFYLAGKGVHILDKERAKLVFGTLAAFLEMPNKMYPQPVKIAKEDYQKADEKLAKAEENYEKTKEEFLKKFKSD